MKLGRRSAETVAGVSEVPTLTSTLNVNAAAFPRVNLVPPAIALESKLRTAKLSVGVTVGLSIAAVAGMYVLAQGQVSSAQDQLDGVSAQVATLTAQLQGFHDYQTARSELTDAQRELDLAMGGEVRWSSLINDISLTLPAGASLTELKGSIDGVSPTYAAKAGQTTGTSGTPNTPVSVLGNAGIGLITYSGEAANYASVAAFLDEVSKQHTMLDPYPNSIQVNNASAGSGSGQPLTFSATVTITDKALSNRWTQKAGS